MTRNKDAHEDDLLALPLTDREREICREALARARCGNAMGIYASLVGVMQSAIARGRDGEACATADLSALSREAIIATIEAAYTHEDYRPLRSEIVRRLRADGARIAELERNRDEGMTMLAVRGERIAELEAQLAANSKSDVPVAVGERVRLRSGTEGKPPFVWTDADWSRATPGSTVMDLGRSPPMRIRVEVLDRLGRWHHSCDPQSLLPPESAKSAKSAEPDAENMHERWAREGADADGTLHDRIFPTSGRLLHASPVFAADHGDEPILDWLAKRTGSAKAAAVRDRKCQYCGMHGPVHKMSCYAGPSEDAARAKAGTERDLQSVLAGVERVAARMEAHAPDRIRGLVMEWAAELREVLR